MARTARQRVLGLARTRAVVRSAHAESLGVDTQVLTRLVAEGALERVGPGRYRSPTLSRSITAWPGRQRPYPAASCACALVFHGLGTQNPSEVWVALDKRVEVTGTRALEEGRRARRLAVTRLEILEEPGE